MNPKQKLEQCAEAFLNTTPLSGLSVYRATRNPISVNDPENTTEPAQQERPCVTLEAEGDHNEAVPFSNVFRGILSVTVEADGSDVTDSSFGALCAQVFDRFNINELTADLSTALDDFTAQFANVISVGSAIRNGQNWQAQIRIDVAYCESE